MDPESAPSCQSGANYQVDSRIKETTIDEQMNKIEPPIRDANIATGSQRGIKECGYSSYIDTSLFALFYCTETFDKFLLRKKENDPPATSEIKDFLRRNVVNTLRLKQFVNGKTVMAMREEMVNKKFFNDSLLGGFMYPTSFMEILFNEVLQVPYFLTFSNMRPSYFYSVRLHHNHGLGQNATLQSVLKKSVSDNTKLKNMPNPALIISLLHTKKIGLENIAPDLKLDLTSFMCDRKDPIICSCKRRATFKCWMCRQQNDIAYCDICKEEEELRHAGIEGHTFNATRVNTVKHTMDLIAVVCCDQLQKYTAYVKCGNGDQSEWLYFDSSKPEVKKTPKGNNVLHHASKEIQEGKGLIRHDSIFDPLFKDSAYYIYQASERNLRAPENVPQKDVPIRSQPKMRQDTLAINQNDSKNSALIRSKQSIDKPGNVQITQKGERDNKHIANVKPSTTEGFPTRSVTNFSAVNNYVEWKQSHSRQYFNSGDISPTGVKLNAVSSSQISQPHGILESPVKNVEQDSGKLMLPGRNSKVLPSVNKLAKMDEKSNAGVARKKDPQHGAVGLLGCSTSMYKEMDTSSTSETKQPGGIHAAPRKDDSSKNTLPCNYSGYERADYKFLTVDETHGYRNKTPQSQPKKRKNEMPSILPPPINEQSVKSVYGYNRGLQLSRNSCYMDSTLFALFFCTNIFDNVVLEEINDDSHATKIRSYLRNNIVSVLRKEKFVSGQDVFQLRQFLVKNCNFTSKLLGSFMDAEEFMYILFQKALHLQPFLKYPNGMKDFMYQIFLPRSYSNGGVATVQKLYEQSMKYNRNLRLSEIPNPALIILLPRSNGTLIGYNKIIPSLNLEISELMTGFKRCACESVASFDCSECDADTVGFCTSEKCLKNFDILHKSIRHSFSKRELHGPVKMKLIAVVCVAHFHYTAFVRCGESWMYFDSMGPQITPIPEGNKILENSEAAHEKGREYWGLNETFKRIFRDCHYCIYQPL